MARQYTQDEIDRDVPEMDREYRDYHKRQMAEIELSPEEIAEWERLDLEAEALSDDCHQDQDPDMWDYFDQLDAARWEDQVA